MKLVIIDYGAGNIKSIQFATERLGYRAILSRNEAEIRSADKVLFPGVGEASSAMRKLRESGLDLVIPTLKQPVLGICLGMQLLCNSSEEGNTRGLGIFDVDVLRFKSDVKVPQIQWNSIKNLKTSLFNNIEEAAYIYMVHSYYVPLTAATIATYNYGVDYSAALAKSNFYGTQFHPEKSSSTGEQILKNFLEITIRKSVINI